MDNKIVKEIPIDDIQMDYIQVRGGEWEDDELDIELVESIKGLGLIHEPMVRPTNSKNYGGKVKDKPYACYVGGRRVHARKAGGFKTVRCIIYDCTDSEAIGFSLSENLGRKNLTPYQKTMAVNKWYYLLKEENGLNDDEAIEKLAKYMGGDAKGTRIARVREYLRTASLPKEAILLLKTKEERTDEENMMVSGLLKEHGIKEDFHMDSQTLSNFEQLFEKNLGFEFKNSDTKNLFAVIGHLKLDQKDTIAQKKIISDLKSAVEEGMDFKFLLEKAVEVEEEYIKSDGRGVSLTIPKEYFLWHTNALNLYNAKSRGALMIKVYKEWLKKLAEEQGW
ncbi:MAG: ParB/RepB/Spo0J family partition protein [Promethearchaeota archaeon]